VAITRVIAAMRPGPGPVPSPPKPFSRPGPTTQQPPGRRIIQGHTACSSRPGPAPRRAGEIGAGGGPLRHPSNHPRPIIYTAPRIAPHIVGTGWQHRRESGPQTGPLLCERATTRCALASAEHVYDALANVFTALVLLLLAGLLVEAIGKAI
jgi:hypothetical protein